MGYGVYNIYESVPRGALCSSVHVGTSHGNNTKEALQNYVGKGRDYTHYTARKIRVKGVKIEVSPLEKKVSKR